VFGFGELMSACAIAIKTGFTRHMDEKAWKALSAAVDVWKDLDQGSATMLVAAFDPLLKRKSAFFNTF